MDDSAVAPSTGHDGESNDQIVSGAGSLACDAELGLPRVIPQDFGAAERKTHDGTSILIRMALETLYLELRALVRKALYDETLVRNGRTVLVVADDLQKELPPLKRINVRDELHIKTLVLLSECYDYYGKFRKALQYSQLGKDILSNMPKRKQGRDDLSQAKVRLAVAYARSMYRRGDLGALAAAGKLLGDCREYVKQYIESPTFPNHGTLGEIAYTLGRVYRQQERFGLALHEFNTAVKEYNDRLVFITKSRVEKKNVAEEEAFSIHKIATIVALGVAWCNYTRGAISTAIQGNLVPSRMLLQRSGDILNSAYADVVYASASRALARKRDAKQLQDARELVTKARLVFEHYHHKHYWAGATLELALIELLSGKVKRAAFYLRACERSRAQGNFRWACSARIVWSRLLRHRRKLADARRVACEALDLARKRRDRLAQIDALIARSEVYRLEGREKHNLAIEDLNKALDLNQTTDATSFANPKVHAVCHLHLAELFLSHDRKDKA
ncbi:MAG: hypothetical protein WAL41_20630, partial [Mycobacterium sp.]